MTTFGIEVEFEENGEALAPRLYHLGLTYDDTIHGYHCDCPGCDYNRPNAYPLRMQRDSTCSGEVISRIFAFDDVDTWRPVLRQLQDAAVDVDAVPGYNSGVHVHVGNGEHPVSQKAAALWAFLAHERALLALSAGRFADVRRMNATLDDLLSDDVERYAEDHGIDVPWNPTGMGIDYGAIKATERQRHAVFYAHRENDRHSNLNLVTRHGGFEFRLWNSTRAAWRMEMFIRLSVAFADPHFVDHLLVCGDTGDLAHDAGVIAEGLNLIGDDDGAALVVRQVHYVHHRVATAPSVLTLV